MTTGVLLMAHGTPASTAGIAPFYTRIRRGRPPSAEQLAELEGRYAAIGGVSPLTVRTAAQVDAVRAALDARAPGRYLVAFGAKHTEPLVEEAAALLRAAGVERVIGLVLTPHGSTMGSQEYVERAAAALSPTPLVAVAPWYAEASLVTTLATRVKEALRFATTNANADGTATRRATVIFTAHSLPERIVERGDTYPEQLAESARLVAEAAGLDDFMVAWQSAGRTPEPWLGPDVRDVVRALAADDLTDVVVICPIGFVADHLEVLYDLDVEVADIAREVGLGYARTASLNDDPAFVATLADLVIAADRAA
jgi:protoporphyrin/coproporphyrin ferrochelatase